MTEPKRRRLGCARASGIRPRARSRVSSSPVPQTVATAAFARVHRELVDAILEEPADFIYGGTTGALAATAEAARRSGMPFAIDFEDFHAGEHAAPDGDLSNALGAQVMQWSAEGAAFVTAGSEAIAAACRDELGIAAIAIHNVFPLPARAPVRRAIDRGRSPFSVCWFSQTIGPDRGLDDVVRALGATDRPASLNLRGCPAAGYMERLAALARTAAPRVALRVLSPVAPSLMVAECAAFDVGVAAEPGHVRNNALALSNKATTYPLAGLPVLITDTAGQRPLADDLGAGALRFSPGDHEALAAPARPVDDGCGAARAGGRRELARRADALALGSRARTRSTGGGRGKGAVVNAHCDHRGPMPAGAPRLYGGIERVVAMLVAGLVRRGHDVTLIAHPDSRTPAPLVPYGFRRIAAGTSRTRELTQIAGALLALRSRGRHHP